MATTNSFQSISHNHHSLLHHNHHHIDIAPSTLLLKPTSTNTTSANISLSTTKIFSISPATSSLPTPASTTESTTFDILRQHLAAQNFREADEETRRLLIVLAGEAAIKRGYVFFSEAQFIPEPDLKTIDALWRQHSNEKFGYSVQKRIYDKSNNDFTKFFIKLGWMKKLDTEVEQYNYRAFPGEFIWELNDDTPEGHLPLTNALRGTQLLKNVLNHPAFKPTEEELAQAKAKAAAGEDKGNGVAGLKGFMEGKNLSNRVLKSDYSF